jgi:hypothetical protein
LPVKCIKNGFISSKKPPPARKPGLSEACHGTFKRFWVGFSIHESQKHQAENAQAAHIFYSAF